MEATGLYSYADRMMRLYGKLQDEQSKELFWARLRFEAEPNMDTAIRFPEIARQNKEVFTSKFTWREEFARASKAGKKIVLYGAGGNGKMYAAYLLGSKVDFYAFCDRNKMEKSICGKPVLSPEELIAHPMSYAVVISTERYHEEVFQFLQENGFPMDAVIHSFDFHGGTAYFEFPELFKPNTAFVDAGCYDGTDTIRFAKWCNGAYSQIFAFEPDEVNYRQCKEQIDAAKIPNVALFKAGLSNASGQTAFAAAASGSSYLLSANQVTITCSRPEVQSTSIRTYMLDELANVEIGMIKMDIEGAEFDALLGAEQVIRRDKPFLAICVYHRQGDMLAIMDYLNKLVPEYRFWLRHYGILSHDTVLYASIKERQFS